MLIKVPKNAKALFLGNNSVPKDDKELILNIRCNILKPIKISRGKEE